jgi:tetratricopeptide (TPR) repeat protein
MELEPQNSSYMNNLAWLFISHDINIDEGLMLINRALEIDPEEPYYLDTKGWGLYKLGSTEQAHEILKRAWDLLPEYDYDIFMHVQEAETVLTR